LLNLAFLFIGAAMVRTPRKLSRAAGWVFVCGGALVLAALVLYSAIYRILLDYRFEVAAIGVTSLVLIAAPVLLSIALLRTRSVDHDQTARLEMSRS
jgi:high-affinity Fe2+/Pb2+ permease